MSTNSDKISSEKLTQLPLKGFHVEVKSPREGWSRMIEGMGNGRFRVKVAKIKR